MGINLHASGYKISTNCLKSGIIFPTSILLPNQLLWGILYSSQKCLLWATERLHTSNWTFGLK